MKASTLQSIKTLAQNPQFISRLEAGNITRDENPTDHFCVYFAAYDPSENEVFMGHHKKSNLWLFNGGHIDKDETPNDTVNREIGEEWGIPINRLRIPTPSLFTITHIPDNQPIPCRIHYDYWYFISVDKHAFHPNPTLLAIEFHENRWLTQPAARTLVTDKNTLKALDLINAYAA